MTALDRLFGTYLTRQPALTTQINSFHFVIPDSKCMLLRWTDMASQSATVTSELQSQVPNQKVFLTFYDRFGVRSEPIFVIGLYTNRCMTPSIDDTI